jgi:hypothetical protein
MTWLDVAMVATLTFVASYGAFALYAWILAEKYERDWRNKFADKEADREW